MTNLKWQRGGLNLLICSIFLFTLLLGCNNQKQSQNESKQHNKFESVDKNEITSFTIHNIRAEEKEIKNKSDRDKIIDLINNVKIIKLGVEPVDGIGYGVKITYSNGEQFIASFTSANKDGIMIYSIGGNGIWCNIDKNIIDNLRSYYDKN